ncbi:MAG: YdbL family protein [Nitrococcus mobilis]|nr:YdbL family protein [Nitrococcus mobilis]
MRVLKILLLSIAMIAAPPAVLAQPSLAEAKAQGLVGERPDGLTGVVVGNPSPAIRQLVEQVNEQRLAEYRRVAQETDAPLRAVQARAGRQIIQRLPRGQYFMDAAGRWRQR